MHEHVRQSGQNVMTSTARLGQDHIARELRELAVLLASLDDDARQSESLLQSSLRAHEEFDRTSVALTEWLTNAETHLQQLSTIEFLMSENLIADCKVSTLLV